LKAKWAEKRSESEGSTSTDDSDSHFEAKNDPL
jgi:hypothetical protein